MAVKSGLCLGVSTHRSNHKRGIAKLKEVEE